MDIRVFFVLPENCNDESEASEIMLQAYESCRQNVVNVAWIKQSEFQTTDFSKTDFVIFQEFKGTNFESLKESKCARILGPWCVFVCLMQGSPIPNFTWPIYNVAMSGCVISCSHISKTKKNEIKEKVQLMGGCYTDSFMSTNTHLVTESVKSEKYLQAAESGVKLFKSQWVEAVYDASQNSNIHCDDEPFLKYKCPPFHNLTISSTGLPNVDMRTQVASIVANNGGIFTASLTLSTTDVLIVHGENGILSKKYKAAKSSPNIYCVTLNWVYDSIDKGYALPHNLYAVQTKGTSTPTRDDETGPNFSIISAIGDITSRYPTHIDDTMAPKKLQPSNLFPPKISPNKRKSSENDEIDKILEGLDIKKAKKAGQYLDGCSVYLAGFKPDQRDKLCKILNLSGATRYDDISERLTHIIVGDSSCPEVKIIKSKNYAVSLVTINWLLDSMERQQAADEENYLISLNDLSKEQFNSPLGKKGLSLLRSNKTLTSKEIAKTEEEQPSQEIQIEDDLMQQYLKSNSKVDDSDTLVQLLKNNSAFQTKRHASENSKDTDLSNQKSDYTEIDNGTSEESNIFQSKKFVIINFSLEDFQNIKDQIESVLGTVMPKNYKGIPDYVVAPVFITTTIQTSALEVVNNYWINECVQECEEIAIEYYHRPLVVTENKPLENCVVTTSGFTSYERIFIKELIEVLGGISQEQFARVLCVEKNVKASTHLVSLEADGKKYAAALKWGLPVITKDWLFECAKTGKLIPEEKFLMGDSLAPSKTSNKSDSSDVKIKSDSPLRSIQNVNIHKTPSSTNSNRKVLTPVSQIKNFNSSKNEKTPVNQRLFEKVGETPCSQVTPINKLMEEVRKTNLLGTPQTPPLPKTWYDVDTPESPFGACIKPHLSPKSKKELMRYINRFPDFVPPPKEQKSTPLSEVKRRCWQKLLGSQESPSRFPSNKIAVSTSQLSLNSSDINEENNEMEIEKQEEGSHRPDETMTNEQNAFINTKLKQIEEMVSAISENRRSSRTFQQPTRTEEETKAPMKDSQPFTVGWDYEEDRCLNKTINHDKPRIFIISGIENEQRQIIVEKIESLGGQVSELNSYDPNCTHLICPKPARNEKTLSCMASGKWILHSSYVDKCVSEGKFLAEEEFEFGNPKSRENIKNTFDKENEFRLQSIYWWRQEISRRGYGAFNDMRAIVVAQKRDPIVRVIEAGGGQVIDAKPPFKDNIHATHCFLEPRSVSDFSVYTPLAQQGILCINTLYISDYLYRTSKDVMDAVVPHFSRFYS